MEANEIFKHTIQGIEWLTMGGGSYIGALIGCQIYDGWPFHKKIQSQDELEAITQEECKKLSIDPAEIDAIYNGDSLGMMRHNEKTKRWELHTGRWQATKNTVRHELYHYLKDVPKSEKGEIKNELLYYCFVAEPRATLYGTFKIKL